MLVGTAKGILLFVCTHIINKTRFYEIKKGKKAISVFIKRRACLTDLINIVSIVSFELVSILQLKWNKIQ